MANDLGPFHYHNLSDCSRWTKTPLLNHMVTDTIYRSGGAPRGLQCLHINNH